MRLSAGTRVGPYEIVAPVGAGGMGEVYRARDTRLQRDVALKVLPDAAAGDADLLARLRREAQVLASLNHPNIAHLYGFEDGPPGAGQASSTALAMELVEGLTLADLIGRQGHSAPAAAAPSESASRGAARAMSIEDALPIARQIADALEAAHEQGIVHRDLKPANVKVRDDGTVKVLDFGLARAFDPTPASGAEAMNSPTLTARATQLGVILGTAAYMSPEQAKGKAIDKRSDVWSFGVVLYEMLTGRRMFAGETVSDTMAQVILKEPDWTALPPEMPQGLRDLLRRCLVKEPRHRLRDIGEARIAIDDLQKEPAASPTRPETPRLSRRRESIFGALALLFFLTTAGALLRPAFAPASIAPPTVRFEVYPPQGTLLTPGSLQLSPDGRRLAFSAGSIVLRAIYVRSLDSSTVERLESTETPTGPPLIFFWSPDSQYLAYFADGKLKKVAASGGPSQVICTLPAGSFYFGTWSVNDLILFSAGGQGPSRIYRVAAGGGQPVLAIEPDVSKSEGFVAPEFLPDGRHYLALRTEPQGASAFVGVLDSTDRRPLPGISSPAQYSSDGYLMFPRDATLLGQRFDLNRLELSGEAFPITDIANSGLFSVSTTGALAYRAGFAAESRLTWLDRTGKRLGVESLTGSLQAPNLSRDGKRVAIERTDAAGTDVWVIDLERGTSTRLTDDAAEDTRPVFSPDGARIAFTRDGIYQKSSSGTGQEERLSGGETTDWSPDGRFISFIDNGALWALPLTGDRKPLLLVETKGNDRRGRFSPDGQWIAYESDFSGRFEVYVQRFPPTAERVQISANGGNSAYWRRDGKELFFNAPDGKIMAVDVKPGPTFQASPPHPVFEVPGIIRNGRFVVTPDGQRFLLPLLDQQVNPSVTVVLNWASGLRP